MPTLKNKLIVLPLLCVSFSNSEQLYVHSDVANIRDKPSGKRIAKLDINTPVQKENEQGEWIYIIGQDNVAGWAHESLFGDHILSEKEIRDSISTSTENKTTWGQRLVKVSPKEITNWELLLQLYKDAADTSGARKVNYVIELLNLFRVYSSHNLLAETLRFLG